MTNLTTGTRSSFAIGGRQLSYLDFAGAGRPLLALHGHMSEAASFAELAAALAPGWRLIALDQRGHGYSDRAAEYSRDGYLADLLALLDHLELKEVVVLGHSLGAINGYQLAARHPERVGALIDVDSPVALGLDGSNPLQFLATLPYEGATRADLIERMGPFAAHFGALVRERADGTWALPFHPLDILESEHNVHGDHWADWLATDCPALLIRGTRGAIPADQAEQMVTRRPNTRLAELDTDHFVYASDPAGFADAVNGFLAEL
ncbi:alpha/beta fold hydrolase [Nocardia arthritidis]|uniref:Alpha/beta fold hydrolase n=1 Tax=Nocardia arthritidis TaxID=228602 RepID=A0A6G9Y6Z1_9NOCA|nr:alpha/beta hydrolase [Nocardia arthritidis]QIS08904.1 alpha/beta fold hydrolase [Nocardia arthritidis]